MTVRKEMTKIHPEYIEIPQEVMNQSKLATLTADITPLVINGGIDEQWTTK